jgi:peptide/nickel transport system substrate-binding protein
VTDKATTPFSKKEVRQALTMAIDFDKIKNEFYGGKAVVLTWPIAPTKEYANAYVALDKLPANVQELYSHNLTKAKELLTAGGYPTGFTATIVSYNTPTYVDYLSLIKDMWADIGVTLNIDSKDLATYSARVRSKSYDELFYYSSSAAWQKMVNITGTSQYNMSYVNDPTINDVLAQITPLVGYEDDKAAELHASLMPYVLEQCYAICKPNPYAYVVWWPWVKNWSGELNLGYYNYPSYLKYRWTDVALKQQMTK